MTSRETPEVTWKHRTNPPFFFIWRGATSRKDLVWKSCFVWVKWQRCHASVTGEKLNAFESQRCFSEEESQIHPQTDLILEKKGFYSVDHYPSFARRTCFMKPWTFLLNEDHHFHTLRSQKKKRMQYHIYQELTEKHMMQSLIKPGQQLATLLLSPLLPFLSLQFRLLKVAFTERSTIRNRLPENWDHIHGHRRSTRTHLAWSSFSSWAVGKTFGRGFFLEALSAECLHLHRWMFQSVCVDNIKMIGRGECLVSLESATREEIELEDLTPLINQSYLDLTQSKIVSTYDATLSNDELFKSSIGQRSHPFDHFELCLFVAHLSDPFVETSCQYFTSYCHLKLTREKHDWSCCAMISSDRCLGRKGQTGHEAQHVTTWSCVMSGTQCMETRGQSEWRNSPVRYRHRVVKNDQTYEITKRLPVKYRQTKVILRSGKNFNKGHQLWHECLSGQQSSHQAKEVAFWMFDMKEHAETCEGRLWAGARVWCVISQIGITMLWRSSNLKRWVQNS